MAFFPVQPDNFRAIPVEKLRFLPCNWKMSERLLRFSQVNRFQLNRSSAENRQPFPRLGPNTRPIDCSNTKCFKLDLSWKQYPKNNINFCAYGLSGHFILLQYYLPQPKSDFMIFGRAAFDQICRRLTYQQGALA